MNLWRNSIVRLLTVALVTAGVYAAPASAAAPAWQVLAATGPTHLEPISDEIQRVAVDATGGSFTLSFEGDSTPALAYDATPGQIAAALNALPSIGGVGGAVEVSGGPGSATAPHPYFVRFGGSLAQLPQIAMTANSSLLTGAAATATISTKVDGGEEGEGEVVIAVANVGGAASNGSPIVAELELPVGIAPTSTVECPAVGQLVTCSRTVVAPPGNAMPDQKGFLIPVTVSGGAPSSSTVEVTVSGGGAVSRSVDMPVVVSGIPATAGIQTLWAGAYDENGVSQEQAGAHPHSAGAGFLVNTIRGPSGAIVPAGDLKDLTVKLPPGFVGNPTVTPRCPQSRLDKNDCPIYEQSSVGWAIPSIRKFGEGYDKSNHFRISNSEPANGYAAQFTFAVAETRAAIFGSLRSDADFGVDVSGFRLPNTFKIYGAINILEGFPPGALGKAFLTNPTDCSSSAPVTRMVGDTWQVPTLFDTVSTPVPAMVGCDQLDFTETDFEFQPTATRGASPTGATADLKVPQDRLLEPGELATPHLKRSVVALPAGLTVNPSAANGLAACSSQQIGLLGTAFPAPNPIRFSNQSPTCPDASKLGTAEVRTPLLDSPLKGTVYLAAQQDNPFGSLLALYIVIDDAKTGIVVKLPGEVTPDPSTGQLTAVFDNNPQLPFEELKLRFQGGSDYSRSTMSTPDVCGTYETKGFWTPWSAPDSGVPVESANSFSVVDNCAPSKAQRPFAPGFEAGTTEPLSGAHSPLSVRLTRPDGQKELRGLNMTLPPGLAATLKGVATCPDAALVAAEAKTGNQELTSRSCPPASEIAKLTVGAGVGPQPIYVNTGRLYLSGPYKGAPLSVTAVVPAVAGPFDLGVQVIRNAAHVDPISAQVRIDSDPFPAILEGIPLQLRDIRVNVDRPNFALNPTNCQEMAIAATVRGEGGASSYLSNRFQVGDCARLGFKPRTNIQLFGRIARAKYQGVRAVVRPRPGDANISRTVVRFPRSAFVAQENIRTVCTRVQWAADNCPKGSIYGRAVAWSPLLDQPLRGNVYLRSSNNPLPDAVADLRGPAHQPIKIEVAVKNDSVKGALRNTVESAPDAPVSYFRLQMFGGKKGLIVNSRNICQGKNQANVNMRAHNGRRSVQKVNVFNKRCKAYKRKLRKAKRKAKRGAHRSKLRAEAGRGR